MIIPKFFTALLARISSMYVVITALCFSIVFFLVLVFLLRNLLNKLEIKKIYRLPIPLFATIVFAVFLIFAGVTSHPLVCQTCHPMRVAARELSQSGHSKITCIACHKESSVMAMPIQKLEQARMIYDYLTGNYRQPIIADVGNNACLTCHSDIAHGIKTWHKVMMSHREVLNVGIRCTDCHDEVAHGNKKGLKGVSMMEKCSGCHNDREASSRCQTCHLEKVWLGMKSYTARGIAHGPNWMKIHGARDLFICKDCHHEKDCNQCHSTVPHPEGWEYIHGQDAKQNPSDCAICHKEEKFCRQCHLVSMPHPPAFLSTHKWEADIYGKKTCLTCHYEEDCDKCHEKHKHKGVLITGGNQRP